MEHTRLVSPVSSCWNQACPDYGKVDHGNIIKFGRTKRDHNAINVGHARNPFVETKDTVSYGQNHD